jgi:hypothetical protein
MANREDKSNPSRHRFLFFSLGESNQITKKALQGKDYLRMKTDAVGPKKVRKKYRESLKSDWLKANSQQRLGLKK